MKYIPLLLVATLPVAALAQQTLQSFAGNFTIFLFNVIVPTLLGIAFLIFAFNAIRYFVLGGGNEDDREKAKKLALFSILGVVLILVFWGIVEILSVSLGFTSGDKPTPDIPGYPTPDFVGGQQQSPPGTAPVTSPAPINDPVVPCNITNPDGSISTPVTLRSNCIAQGGTPQ